MKHPTILAAVLLSAAIAFAAEEPLALDSQKSSHLKKRLETTGGLTAPDRLRDLIQESGKWQAKGNAAHGAVDKAANIVKRLEAAGFLQDNTYAKNVVEMYRRNRIVGTTTQPDTTHPDCVAVGRSAGRYCCSGTLVAPQVVITAGHCAGGCAAYVLVGGSIDAADRQVFRVRQAHVHPAYTGNQGPDLTVLILETPVTTVAPRRIARTAEIDGAIDATIVGFGNTNAEGTTGYGRRLIGGPAAFADPADPAYGANAEIEVVLGKHPDGLDSCNGDSGGPIFISTPAGEAVAGATSRAVANSSVNCGDGGIYVRLDRCFGWIVETAQAAGVQPPVL